MQSTVLLTLQTADEPSCITSHSDDIIDDSTLTYLNTDFIK